LPDEDVAWIAARNAASVSLSPRFGSNANGCGSFMTEEDRVKRPHFTSLSRGFGIGFGATPSA
jgi:hypothetical protein